MNLVVAFTICHKRPPIMGVGWSVQVQQHTCPDLIEFQVMQVKTHHDDTFPRSENMVPSSSPPPPSSSSPSTFNITCSPVRSPSSKGNPSNFRFFDLVKAAAPPAWWSFSLNQILLRAWKPASYLQNWRSHKKEFWGLPCPKSSGSRQLTDLTFSANVSRFTWRNVGSQSLMCTCEVVIHLVVLLYDMHLGSTGSFGCAHVNLFYDIFAR